jgi:hypothetical protein
VAVAGVIPGDAVASGNDEKQSGITVSVSVCQKLVEQRLRVLVTFEFKNTSRKVERLERWLALQPEGVAPAVLRVFDKNGVRIRYIGPFTNRKKKERTDFVAFRPGQSILVPAVDVTDFYDWPMEAQQVRIKYRVFSSGQGSLELLESESVDFNYQPVIPRPELPRNKLIRKSSSTERSEDQEKR